MRVCVGVYPRNVLLDAECQADGPAVGTGATGFAIEKNPARVQVRGTSAPEKMKEKQVCLNEEVCRAK